MQSKPLGRPPLHGSRLIRRSVALPREVWDRLREEAKARRMSVAALVRALLSTA